MNTRSRFSSILVGFQNQVPNRKNKNALKIHYYQFSSFPRRRIRQERPWQRRKHHQRDRTNHREMVAGGNRVRGGRNDRPRLQPGPTVDIAAVPLRFHLAPDLHHQRRVVQQLLFVITNVYFSTDWLLWINTIHKRLFNLRKYCFKSSIETNLHRPLHIN